MLMRGLVAVTGASGHVGGALLRELLERGVAVRALDLRPPPGLEVDWHPVDVLDPAALREHLQGVDVVFHLAARISIAGDPDGPRKRCQTCRSTRAHASLPPARG